jgi:hypothetical protein
VKIKKSDPRSALRRVYFTCVDASALQTRLQASDMSTFVVYISKNGATAVASSASPVEVDATRQKGRFYLQLTAAECDTPGSLGIDIKNTGGTKSMEPRELDIEIAFAHFATVSSGTTTAITCDRTETTTDYFKDDLVKALTGANASQTKKIGTYAGNGSIATIGLASGLAFASAFSNGDIIEILSE